MMYMRSVTTAEVSRMESRTEMNCRLDDDADDAVSAIVVQAGRIPGRFVTVAL
jgi:hypothetical protein